MTRAPPLFGEASRLQMTDSIRLTAEALSARATTHPHWIVAWSGGKDSTTVLTVTLALIEHGMVPRPRSLTVLYADTRMELLPLWQVAADLREDLDERDIPHRVVMAPLDKRLLVYILGRGVPPPNNGTLRWCTRQIKIDPMAEAIAQLADQTSGRVLLLTGVRLGESAARDERIATSCSKDGGECGQGRFRVDLSGDYDVLDPILHWRICHVWEWLWSWAPTPAWGGWETRALAEAYGGRDGDEATETQARTGCVGCPLATRDLALDGVLRIPRWGYLAPLKQIRPLWRELRRPCHRLRMDGTERRKDGTLVANPGRWGPLTLGARSWALDEVLRIQAEVNDVARRLGRPLVDMLNAEEERRIRELVAANTWPDRWTGEEIRADEWIDEVYADGTVQPLLPGIVPPRGAA